MPAEQTQTEWIRWSAGFYLDEEWQHLPADIRWQACSFLEALTGVCRAKRTDGVLSLATALAVGRAMEVPGAELLERLASPEIGLVELGGGVVVVVPYSKWQDSAEDIDEASARRSEAARKAGRASGEARRSRSANASNDEGTDVERTLNAALNDEGPAVERRVDQSLNEIELEERRGENSEDLLRRSSRRRSGKLPEGSEPPRLDVNAVCGSFTDHLRELGVKPPDPPPEPWQQAARLMLDADDRDQAEVLEVIAWLGGAAGRAFWARNVLSLPKLRTQYDRLRLEMRSGGQEARPPANGSRRIHGGDLRRLAAHIRQQEAAGEAPPHDASLRHIGAALDDAERQSPTTPQGGEIQEASHHG